MSSKDCRVMAFVPYVPSVLPVPTALSTSSRKILPATTSTYVYSKPVTSSYSCSSTILIPHSHPVSKEVNKNVAPDQETDGGQVTQPKRTRFTVYQRGELEKKFAQTQYISPRERRTLSQQLGIPIEIIQTWFKNRRVKWRKEQRQRQPGAGPLVASPSAGLYFHYFGNVPYPNSKLMLNDARMLYGPCTAHAYARDEEDEE